MLFNNDFELRTKRNYFVLARGPVFLPSKTPARRYPITRLCRSSDKRVTISQAFYFVDNTPATKSSYSKAQWLFQWFPPNRSLPGIQSLRMWPPPGKISSPAIMAVTESKFLSEDQARTSAEKFQLGFTGMGGLAIYPQMPFVSIKNATRRPRKRYFART